MTITMNDINRLNDSMTGELSGYGLMIMKFEQSGEKRAQIENRTSKSTTAFAEMIHSFARLLDLPHIKVMVINGEVWMFNLLRI